MRLAIVRCVVAADCTEAQRGLDKPVAALLLELLEVANSSRG